MKDERVSQNAIIDRQAIKTKDKRNLAWRTDIKENDSESQTKKTKGEFLVFNFLMPFVVAFADLSVFFSFIIGF